MSIFLKPPSEPIALFRQWFAEAEAKEVNDPNAMMLSTVDAQGQPSARIVLLRGVDERGFVFYTNTHSDKGQQITANPRVALAFHWKSWRRQVRIEGVAESVTNAEADAYFAQRPRLSQLGAWASLQSSPMGSPDDLISRLQDYERQFANKDVPRPPHWSGYRVRPSRIEFWEERDARLHDRMVYVAATAGPYAAAPHTPAWRVQRLFP